MAKFISLKEIWAFMDECSEGWRAEENDHYWVVYPGDKSKASFRTLRLGRHGHRRAGQTEVEATFVRKMARQFEIVECAKRVLPEAYPG